MAETGEDLRGTEARSYGEEVSRWRTERETNVNTGDRGLESSTAELGQKGKSRNVKTKKFGR